MAEDQAWHASSCRSDRDVHSRSSKLTQASRETLQLFLKRTTYGGVRVALAQHLLADRQNLLVEGLGGGVVPLRLEQRRQVVQAVGGFGVALALHRLVDRQGL